MATTKNTYVATHSNRLGYGGITGSRVANHVELERLKIRWSKKSKKSSINHDSLESNHNSCYYTYNHKKLPKSLQYNSENIVDFNYPLKNIFKGLFDQKSYTNGKNRSRSIGTAKLPFIRKLRYNFFEAIQENFDEDNSDKSSMCSESDKHNKTPNPKNACIHYLPLH